MRTVTLFFIKKILGDYKANIFSKFKSKLGTMPALVLKKTSQHALKI